jgi:hypothetical protein
LVFLGTEGAGEGVAGPAAAEDEDAFAACASWLILYRSRFIYRREMGRWGKEKGKGEREREGWLDILAWKA